MISINLSCYLFSLTDYLKNSKGNKEAWKLPSLSVLRYAFSENMGRLL